MIASISVQRAVAAVDGGQGGVHVDPGRLKGKPGLVVFRRIVVPRCGIRVRLLGGEDLGCHDHLSGGGSNDELEAATAAGRDLLPRSRPPSPRRIPLQGRRARASAAGLRGRRREWRRPDQRFRSCLGQRETPSRAGGRVSSWRRAPVRGRRTRSRRPRTLRCRTQPRTASLRRAGRRRRQEEPSRRWRHRRRSRPSWCGGRGSRSGRRCRRANRAAA